MKIWVTRDGDGSRSIFFNEPVKVRDVYTSEMESLWDGFFLQTKLIDAVIGKGNHGIKKGGIKTVRLEIKTKKWRSLNVATFRSKNSC